RFRAQPVRESARGTTYAHRLRAKGDEGQPVGCLEGLVSGPRRLTDRRRAPKVVPVARTPTRRATGARNASGQAPVTPAMRGADQKPSGHDGSAPYPPALSNNRCSLGRRRTAAERTKPDRLERSPDRSGTL